MNHDAQTCAHVPTLAGPMKSVAKLACIALPAAAIAFSAMTASAQQNAVCSNNPGPEERIECAEDAASTDDIDIDADGVEIDTTENLAHGIVGTHRGTGRLAIRVRNATITTTGTGDGNDLAEGARGIYGRHSSTATGDIVLDVANTKVVTEGSYSAGITGDHTGFAAADVDIDVRNSTIETKGDFADGIAGNRGSGTGNVDIDVVDTSIATAGTDSNGISASIDNADGNVEIGLVNTDIATTGENSDGIDVAHEALIEGGDVVIAAQGGSITTENSDSSGVQIRAGTINRASPINVDIDIQDLDIATRGESAHGIAIFHAGNGAFSVDARGGSIGTQGDKSHGIDARTAGYGDIIIVTGEGHAITTEGTGSIGIQTTFSNLLDISGVMAVTVGGSVDARGADAHGVQLGSVDDQGNATNAAPIAEDGYRKQTVTVNGRVWGGTGNAAGVWLAGGGRVVIGPEGKVGARSGLAIHATGDTPVDGGDPIKPTLLVHLMPDGRHISELFDGQIVNDGGETTIVLNNVVVHDGATGATGRWAPNGARDVTVKASTTIADRNFTAEDFINGPYGPRAAVYESLPSLLLRLNGRAGFMEPRPQAADSPIRLRLVGGTGSYEAEQATVGAEYDLDRSGVEVGAHFRFGESLVGTVEARLVSGSVDISAPTGGGTIDSTGRGLATGLAWHGADGLYADGRLSATWFDMDATSDTRGPLAQGVGALVHTLDLEGGRRFALDGQTALTPRARLSRTDMSVDRFTDTVGSRVAVSDSERLTGSIGGVIETVFAWKRGQEELSLHGSLDVERTLSGDETVVLVSDEPLKSTSPRSRVLLGIGGSYVSDGLSLHGTIGTLGLASNDAEYVGRLGLKIAF